MPVHGQILACIVGISKTQLGRLGTIYFSTKKKGTGLGLTFFYQLINSINGTVSVRSKPGEGTEFTISLPLNQLTISL
jgi:two-component system, sporulation sensor kinase B